MKFPQEIRAQSGPTRVNENRPGKPEGRFAFIDALRGIAAVMVLMGHLYAHGPLYDPLSTLVIRPISFVFEHGNLGVQIFFVLSGFVIAYSQRTVFITGRFLGNFALRRSLRLDPTYWTAIALFLFVDYASNLILTDRTIPFPNSWVILANVLYLQNIMGVRNIVGPSWTLCLEVQLYLALTVLVAFAQRLPWASRPLLGWRQASFLPVFIPLAIVSLLMGTEVFGVLKYSAFFPPHWYMFFLGVLAWWTIEGLVGQSWFWAYAAAVSCGLAFHFTPEMAMALATGLVIYVMARLGHLRSSLNYPMLQFFGRISYSLYLVHVAMGDRLLCLGKRISGESVPWSVVWFLLAVTLSVSVAYIVNRCVEVPSVALAKWVRTRYSESCTLPDTTRVSLSPGQGMQSENEGATS